MPKTVQDVDKDVGVLAQRVGSLERDHAGHKATADGHQKATADLKAAIDKLENTAAGIQLASATRDAEIAALAEQFKASLEVQKQTDKELADLKHALGLLRQDHETHKEALTRWANRAWLTVGGIVVAVGGALIAYALGLKK